MKGLKVEDERKMRAFWWRLRLVWKMVKKLFSSKSREDGGGLVEVQPKKKEGCWVVSVKKMRENQRGGGGRFRLIRFKFLYFCFFLSPSKLDDEATKKKLVPQLLSFGNWSFANFFIFCILNFLKKSNFNVDLKAHNNWTCRKKTLQVTQRRQKHIF